MAQMTLLQIRDALRLHLKDDGTVWSDPELTRAYTHALADFSRFSPYERYYEARVDTDEITDETVTLTAHGTWKDLTYKPVKWESERVCDDADETTKYTRGTDYEIDYINGKITSISGGDIGATDTVYVNYTRDKTAIDLSSLTYLRIKQVEYPVGQVPRDIVGYELFGDIMFILTSKSSRSASQEQLMNDKHVRVWYYAPHTAATASAAGTAPEWSDEIMIKGGEAYAYLIEAGQYNQQAITDFASARTALGNISHTDLDTALDLINTIIDNGVATLALIGTGSLHTAVTTAVDAANAALDNLFTASQGNELYDATQVTDMAAGAEGDIYLIGATAPSMDKYLDDGDANIETIDLGDNEAGNYREYAESAGNLHAHLRDISRFHLQRAAARAQGVQTYIAEAEQRINQIAAYIQEAQTEGTLANAAAREAEARVAQIDRYLNEAAVDIESAVQNLTLAEKYRDMGILRRNEFWSILGDRAQGGLGKLTVTGNQSPYSGGGGKDYTVG